MTPFLQDGQRALTFGSSARDDEERQYPWRGVGRPACEQRLVGDGVADVTLNHPDRDLGSLLRSASKTSEGCRSHGAVHGDGQGFADVSHPLIAQASETFDEHTQRDTLDRVEVDRR